MITYRSFFLPFFFLTLSFFLSCTDEEKVVEPSKKDQTANQWIEETMRHYYLWYNDIPDSSRLNFSLEPDKFFESLLSGKDGKNNHFYSTINKKNVSSKAYMGDSFSFGFEFLYYRVQEKPDKFALRVLYVAPNSPAAQGGLKRDTWIHEMNGKAVSNNTSDIINTLYKTASSTVRLGISDDSNKPVERQVELTSSPDILDNPVFAHKTISLANGKKAGYLLYNHFTAGPVNNGQDETFNNSLRDAFVQFKAGAPDEFILDLRYNGGGLVSCAQLLSSMLAPENALNDVFCNLTYNDKNVSSNKTLSLEPVKYGSQTLNLNLKRLFVITSDRTASASEAVINGLLPYMDVVIVGKKTEGKNVGSITLTDDRFEWELHPIVSHISNKKGDDDDYNDYANGFLPRFECVETYQNVFYELGDEREFILKQVLNYINYGTAIESKSSELRNADGTCLVPLYNSLERKESIAIIPSVI